MTDKAIPDPDKIGAIKPIGPEEGAKSGSLSPTQSFASFMQSSPTPAAQQSTQISPFSLMQGNTPVTTTPNIDTLMGQLNRTQGVSSDIQTQLQTPQLKLKASTKYLLKNKLSEANDHLRSLNTKIGASVPSETSSSTMTGPFGKFIGYLTGGQQMMDSAKKQLQNLKSQGTSLTPGDFLMVQLKINKAQQLLEFSSVLLSNAVSDIKQFMQIQM